MDVDVDLLFQPLNVRGKVLRNRIVMPPMVVLRGLTTPDGVEWYGRRARGGAGLVIVEATSVRRFGSELTGENLESLVNGIHDGGALAAIQLFPQAFRQSISPSDLNPREIDEIVSAYRVASEICVQAGFDGVEPHGAHGYLLNQFLSSVQNQRRDGYGGSLQNRMWMARRIVESTRQGAGQDTLLLYRHTPLGEGYGMEESLALAEELVKDGVDILDISPASADAPGDRAAPFRTFGVPVIAVGQLDRIDRALEVLREHRADLVAIGRGLIADPEWPIKVREGRFDEMIRCIRCNEKCGGHLQKGIPIECTQWASQGT
jgi:2,4-dienoyl-CoA reductase-like NADH-dependent reductase (Old Yellow Enzyme family)